MVACSASAQTVDEGEGFFARVDFAVELGVAGLFEQVEKCGPGVRPWCDQVGAVEERRRIEAFGGPGQAFASRRRRRDRSGPAMASCRATSSAAPSCVSSALQLAASGSRVHRRCVAGA